MVAVGQIYSCSGIKLNTTVVKSYGWSHGGVENKDCEQDTPLVDPLSVANAAQDQWLQHTQTSPGLRMTHMVVKPHRAML